jgi:DNA gyrase subunit A
MYREPSNKNGRLFARIEAGDEVVAAELAMGGEHVCVATRDAHLLCFPLPEAPALKAAGKGTTAIKLHDGDEVIAYELAREKGDGPVVVTGTDREVVVNPGTYAGGRAARGRQILKREGLKAWNRKPGVVLGKAKPGGDGAPEPTEGTEEAEE